MKIYRFQGNDSTPTLFPVENKPERGKRALRVGVLSAEIREAAIKTFTRRYSMRLAQAHTGLSERQIAQIVCQHFEEQLRKERARVMEVEERAERKLEQLRSILAPPRPIPPSPATSRRAA